MHPEIAEVLPALRTVARVKEAARQLADIAAVLVHVIGRGGITRNLRELTRVRPAGEGHGPVIEKQFAMRRYRRPAKAARFHLAEIRNAERMEVQLDHLPARLFVKSCKHGRIGDGGEAGQGAPAEQANAFVLVSAPDDGRLRGAGVRGGEFKRIGAKVVAAAQPDRDRAFGQSAPGLKRANRIARPLQRGEGFCLRAGVGVTAVGGDKVIRSGEDRSREEQCDDEDQANQHGGG